MAKPDVQDKRPLIIAAAGAEGAAAAKAVLEWEPLQAMATEAPVLYVCLAQNKQSAAFLGNEDKWRAGGITVCNMFLEDVQKAGPTELQSSDSVQGDLTADEWCAFCDNTHHLRQCLWLV
jgi:hypothetical protein